MKASIVSATEAGRALPRLLTGLSQRDGACYITDGDGQARAVLLDVDRYHAMMDAVEAAAGDVTGSDDAKLAGSLIRAILDRSKKKSS